MHTSLKVNSGRSVNDVFAVNVVSGSVRCFPLRVHVDLLRDAFGLELVTQQWVEFPVVGLHEKQNAASTFFAG